MKSEVQNFASQDHKNTGMCVVVMMSHGNEGILEGTDGKDFKEDDLFEMFSDTKCPSMKGKPKLFMFSACRYG